MLNALHQVTMPACQLAVLGALLLPLRWADLSAIEVGKTVFLHKSAPKGWWGEQFEHMQRGPGPAVLLARISLAPYTMTETMQKLEPMGIDRWPFELALKYRMRDILSCPRRRSLVGRVLVAPRSIPADARTASTLVLRGELRGHSPPEGDCSVCEAIGKGRFSDAT